MRLLLATALALTGIAVACAPELDIEREGPVQSPVLWDGVTSPLLSPVAVDGDSLRGVLDGNGVEVRLVGINAPERRECWGFEARRHLETLLRDADVGVAVTGRDQFDRLLGYVVVDGEVVNAQLLSRGAALATSTEHDLRDRFDEVAAAAMQRQLGMWGPAACGEHRVPNIEIVEVIYDPRGRDEVHLGEEYVTLRSEEPADLTGWVVRDESSQNRFVFPAGTSITPGVPLRVRTGCGADDTGNVHWCADGPVWNNDGDTALLMTPRGTVVDTLRYGFD